MPRRLAIAGPRLLLAAALAVAVALVGAADLVRKVDSFRPLGFTARSNGMAWKVVTVDDPATGLRPGDSIVLVDGGDAGPASALRQRLLAEGGHQLTVIRGGEPVVVPYAPPGLRLDLPYLALAGAGILYLIIGLYALLHGRRSPSGVFFLWSVASAAVYLCAQVPGAPFDGMAKASYVAEELGRLLLPPLTLHLFLIFPLPLLRRRLRRLVPFLYVPAAALLALQADLMFNRGRWFFGGVRSESLVAFDKLEIALLVLFSLAALVALGWQLARRHGWEQRRQLQWVVLGLAGGYLPFVALYGVPLLLHLALPAWTVAAATVPLVLVPLTFAWALLRFRLWDMELILRGAVSYTATLLLGVLSFSLLHLAITRGLSADRGLARTALSFVSGLAIAAVLVPAERRVRAGIERLQHRGTFAQRRALRELGRELLEERDLPRLCERLQQRLAEGLGLREAALYLVDDEQLRLAGNPRTADVAPASGPAPPALVPLAELDEVWGLQVARLSSAGLPGVAPQGLERLYAAGFRYAFPLASRRRPVALLLTGGRLDGEPLNSEELDLLRVVLDQTALALENARLVEELRNRLAEVTRLKQESESILESSPAGIVVLDGSERVVSSNGAFSRLTGLRREQLVGRRLLDALPVEPLPGPDEPLREVSYCEPDGRERHLQLSLAACGRDADDLRVLVVHDVSERVAMENALKEKDRLAALGMLAAGVAHEVNTPITGISSYAQMLLAETPSDDPRYELLRKVEKQTFRAASIVNDLLEFARDRKQEHRTLPLAGVIRDALESLDDRLRQAPVELHWQPPANDGPTVRGGDQELQQVFVNLIGNALDAMGEHGGRLELTVGTDGDRAYAAVADSGPGIPRAEQERIFRPFYSTKLASGGTGLGLSISYQIVRRHGGDLRVESDPGHGSRFIVELPLPDGDATGGLW